VEIEFDPAKDALNIRKHNISLARVVDLKPFSIVEDQRYSEPRFRAYGTIDGLAYCFAYVMRGEITRVISLRRAHEKEMRKHVPQKR